MVKGKLAEIVERARPIIEEAPFTDEMWRGWIGRAPKDKAKLTDAEVLGLLYIQILEQYGPKVEAEANRETRRARKRKR